MNILLKKIKPSLFLVTILSTVSVLLFPTPWQLPKAQASTTTYTADITAPGYWVATDTIGSTCDAAPEWFDLAKYIASVTIQQDSVTGAVTSFTMNNHGTFQNFIRFKLTDQQNRVLQINYSNVPQHGSAPDLTFNHTQGPFAPLGSAPFGFVSIQGWQTSQSGSCPDTTQRVTYTNWITVPLTPPPVFLPRLDLTKIQSTFSYPTNGDSFGIQNVQSASPTLLNWSGSKNVAWINALTGNAGGGTGLSSLGLVTGSFTVDPAQALIGVNSGGIITENCLASSTDTNGVASGCEAGWQTRTLGVQYTVPGPGVTLTANPPGPVIAGTTVTLTWTGTNCNTTSPVSSSNFGAANTCSGTKVVTPVVPSSTYTITIKGLSNGDASGANFATQQVVVNVSSVPVMSNWIACNGLPASTTCTVASGTVVPITWGSNNANANAQGACSLYYQNGANYNTGTWTLWSPSPAGFSGSRNTGANLGPDNFKILNQCTNNTTSPTLVNAFVDIIINAPSIPVLSNTIACNGLPASQSCTTAHLATYTMTWGSTNATSCDISYQHQADGSLGTGTWYAWDTGLSGNRPTAANGPNVIRFKNHCVNSGASPTVVNNTVDVTVSAPVGVPVVTLQGRTGANAYSNGPISITSGATVDLQWTTTNSPTSCTATNGWSGAKNTAGGTEPRPGVVATTTYTLTCTNAGGTSAPVSFTANILTVSLTAIPNSGTAPLNAVDLVSTVAGVSSGTYRYFLDCTNNGSNELDITNSINPYTAVDLCNYPTAATYLAKVTVWHNQGTATDTFTVTTTNSPPIASNAAGTSSYCFTGPDTITITWTYTDPNNVPLGTDPQSAYQVQIDTDQGSFQVPEYDSGKLSGVQTSHGVNGLQLGTGHRARVRVWDSLDLISAWSLKSQTFQTPVNAFPRVDFCWPENCSAPTPGPKPKANLPVQFNDRTIFYDGSNNTDWLWTFGDSGTSTVQNPSHTYLNIGSYTVTLLATDTHNQACSVSKQIKVTRAIPIWKEISPGQ